MAPSDAVLGLGTQNNHLYQPQQVEKWFEIADEIFTLLTGSPDIHIINPHISSFFLLALLINELND